MGIQFLPIPPIPHLSEFAQGKMHLLLPPLLNMSVYWDHYYDLAQRGAYLILDNGAFEDGHSIDPTELINLAVDVRAREVVASDVLMDRIGTMDAAYEFLQAYKRTLEDRSRTYPLNIMLVPQGNTIYEWGRCLQDLIKLFKNTLPGRQYSIGIPQRTEAWVGGRANLIARFIESMYYESGRALQVHLLGAHSEVIKLAECALRFPWIRSVDTVKPFTFALEGITIPKVYARTQGEPKRPGDYFTRVLTESQLKIARDNISIYNRRLSLLPLESEVTAL
jgi:hypothetical protein